MNQGSWESRRNSGNWRILGKQEEQGELEELGEAMEPGEPW